MAYGLEFYGANNQLIFDTDNFDGGQTLVITGSGTISNNGTFTPPNNTVTFGRVNTGNLFGNTSNGVLTNRSGQTISYVSAEFTSSSTSNITNAGTYGLEIFSGSGGLMFSTRKAASTVDFQAIYDKGDLRTNNSTNSVWAGSPSNVYVSIDFMFYGGANNYMNGYTFSTGGISYRGRLFATGQFNWDYVLPNMGTLAVIKLRG
jgi:hypothetical protein